MTTKVEPLEVKVKGHSIDQTVGTEEGAGKVKIKGTLPKHGPAKGTIDVSQNLGTLPGEPEGGGPEYFGDCESGVLPRSAARK